MTLRTVFCSRRVISFIQYLAKVIQRMLKAKIAYIGELEEKVRIIDFCVQPMHSLYVNSFKKAEKRVTTIGEHGFEVRVTDYGANNITNSLTSVGRTVFKSEQSRFEYLRKQEIQASKAIYQYTHRKYSTKCIESGLTNIVEAISKLQGISNVEARFRMKKKKKIYENSYGSDKRLQLMNNSFALSYSIDNLLSDGFCEIYDADLSDISQLSDQLTYEVEKDIHFKNANCVAEGRYTCIFSPEVTGLFTHECMGHLFEADYYKKYVAGHLQIGSLIGPQWLNVVDDGHLRGSGYVPFDDEGSDAHNTHIVKNGVLCNLLTDIDYAGLFGNELSSGNSRAKHPSTQNLIRMTSTFMGQGKNSVKDIFAFVEHGIYIESSQGAFLRNNFYLKPRRAYLVKHGKIIKPLLVSYISGNTYKMISNILYASNVIEPTNSIFGGCQKKGQAHLRVSYGGPYIVVKDVYVV